MRRPAKARGAAAGRGVEGLAAAAAGRAEEPGAGPAPGGGIAATAWGVSQIFSGRAMFLQIGAMIGTIMSSNVFFRIIPAQKHMLAMTRANQPVDTSYGLRAKKHSTHNHYLTLPVLFAMLSNHFPSMYGHRQAWLVLVLVMVAGAGVKRFMNSRLATPKPLMVLTLLALGTVGWMTGPRALEMDAGLVNAPKVSFATAQSIVQAHGGIVTLSTTVEQGSTFRITLPVTQEV